MNNTSNCGRINLENLERLIQPSIGRKLKLLAILVELSLLVWSCREYFSYLSNGTVA